MKGLGFGSEGLGFGVFGLSVGAQGLGVWVKEGFAALVNTL